MVASSKLLGLFGSRMPQARIQNGAASNPKDGDWRVRPRMGKAGLLKGRTSVCRSGPMTHKVCID